MDARPVDDFPRVLTPEHAKRSISVNRDEAKLHPEIAAAYAYVESVTPASDYVNPTAWTEWAVREAFLAGISFAQNGFAAK